MLKGKMFNDKDKSNYIFFIGMVRMLQDREVDFSFVQYSVTADRSEVMDFSSHIFFEILKLYMKKPASAFSARMDAFFKVGFVFVKKSETKVVFQLKICPFFQDFQVVFWLVFTGMFTLLGTLFYMVHAFQWENFHHTDDSEPFGITNGFGVIGLAIIRRDYPIRVRRNFAKVLYFCLLYTSPSPRDRQKSRMPSSA